MMKKYAKPSKRKPIQTPKGRFESRDEAAAHYKCAGPNMNYFLWRYPDQFYYIKTAPEPKE